MPMTSTATPATAARMGQSLFRTSCFAGLFLTAYGSARPTDFTPPLPASNFPFAKESASFPVLRFCILISYYTHRTKKMQ